MLGDVQGFLEALIDLLQTWYQELLDLIAEWF